MAMMRMNMGQKHAAKNMTRQAFQQHKEDSEAAMGVGSANSSASRGGASSSSRGPSLKSVMTRPSLPGSKETTKATYTGVAPTRSDTARTDVFSSKSAVQIMDEKQLSKLSLGSNSDEDSTFVRRFNLTMGALIFLNTIIIAIETDNGYDDASSLEDKIGWIIVDTLFIAVFLGEIIVRICLEGPRQWARSAWNWFDVVIVIVAILDIWILTWMSGDRANLHFLTIFRIVRLVRLVRLVKLVRLLRGLYVILIAFWNALQTLSFLVALMLFGLMIYAIVAVNLIGRNEALQGVRINGDTIKERFGTVYKSMYSLFEIMTLEGWEQVARPIVEQQPGLFIFILSFIMIFTFGLLNMVVAMVIDKTLMHTRIMGEDDQRREQLRIAEEFERVHKYFVGGSAAKAGCISLEEFETCLNESETIHTLLDRMGVMPKEARELYMVLDWNESGAVTIEEFMDGLVKLQEGTVSAWDSMATHSNARSIGTKVRNLEDSVHKVTNEQDHLIRTLSDHQQWLASLEAGMDRHTEMLRMIAEIAAPGQVPVPHLPGYAAGSMASSAAHTDL